jgi:peptide/nickel transport system ATP-binding protein
MPDNRMTDPLLEVTDLSICFHTTRGTLKALRHVNLRVPKNRIVGIVGESGCGKSTLIYAIIRLLAANARIETGKILFQGNDLIRIGEEKLRSLRGDRISMVFQDPMTFLNPVLSIGTQMADIQFRLNTSGAEKRERAVRMLTRVGIPDPHHQLRRFPHQFSGGMRQRIAIAMALMAKPDLLIADEPTTALDATLEVQIIQLLKKLQSDIGCSILFISHHLGLIAELCDLMVVMYAGEVVEEGPVRQVFRNPAHPYTQALLQCDPGRIREKTKTLPTIAGDIPDLHDPPHGCIFRNRCPFNFDPCGAASPPLLSLGENHRAACHLIQRQTP